MAPLSLEPHPVDTRRQALRARFQETREFTERLCAPLVAEDYVVQSMPDCSPTKWHLAHVSWFFETFLLGPNVADVSVSRSGLRVPLQLVLQRRRRQVPAARARPDLAADGRRGLPLPRLRRRARAGPAGVRRRRRDRQTRAARRAGPESRAAAPGADRDRPQAHAVASIRFIPCTSSVRRVGRPNAAAARGSDFDGRAVLDRPRRRRLRLRQRGAAPPASSCSRSSWLPDR